MTKISVIIGVYNGAKRIETAIQSILNQTYKDFEIIMCDDGSTDESYKVMEKLSECDNRVKIIRNNENLGLAETLNKCLKMASGEYIARMDDDDISHPNRFEKQVLFLEGNPEYALVGTGRNKFDENGIWATSSKLGERKTIDIFLGRSFVHPTTMIRKNVLISVKGYTTGKETERTEDYDLWCKLYQNGHKGYNLDDILLDYYESRSSYSKRKYKYRLNEFNLKRVWYKKLNIPKKYFLTIFKPLIVGMIPPKLLIRYKKNIGKF